MITVLPSNTSIEPARRNGLNDETLREAGQQMPGRGSAAAGVVPSADPPSSRGARTTPTLTPEALLAVQTEAGAPATDASDPSDNPGSEPGPAAQGTNPAGAGAGSAQAAEDAASEDEADQDGDGLTEEEEEQVEDLKARDREVRAHEQAHARAGGAYAGAPSYTFQQGPDGKRYAIGGEVQIDTSKERTAEATIRKMQIVIRAATAPAEPSSQDLKVAQQARAQLAEAQAEARQERAEGLSGQGDGEGDVSRRAREEQQPTDVAGEAERQAEARSPGVPEAANRLLAQSVYDQALAGNSDRIAPREGLFA